MNELPRENSLPRVPSCVIKLSSSFDGQALDQSQHAWSVFAQGTIHCCKLVCHDQMCNLWELTNYCRNSQTWLLCASSEEVCLEDHCCPVTQLLSMYICIYGCTCGCIYLSWMFAAWLSLCDFLCVGLWAGFVCAIFSQCGDSSICLPLPWPVQPSHESVEREKCGASKWSVSARDSR